MEFFQESYTSYYNTANNNQRFTSEKTDHFIVDDLLNIPTDDIVTEGCAFVTDTSTDSSTAVDSCNSSSQCGAREPSLAGDDGCRSFVDNRFSGLCIPYDDLAEFEWLSNLVEESFSNEDVQKHKLLSGVKSVSEQPVHRFKPRSENNSLFGYDMTIPGKARTKRLRVTSHNWASRFPIMSSNSKPDIISNNSTEPKKINITLSKNEEGRKCLHCATNKTPQWRTGPMGPRTLCNACGVRYKSGRLVPEYRPASSPTFVLTKHSNSHRKVLELRRQKMQKTMHRQQPFMNHQDVMLQMPNADNYYFIPHP